MAEGLIAAFDPGRNIGFALVDQAGRLLHHAVIGEGELPELDLAAAGIIVAGNGTGSARLVEQLSGLGRTVLLIDETGSTLEARELYYRLNPVRGLSRLLPAGLRSPARQLDDYAAYALALRYLAQRAQHRVSP
jgi:hypothetical protein